MWVGARTSSHRFASSWHNYQPFYTSSHEVQANELQLITQALICSEWGEHVTEPLANKSSQLLLLIITVITLIIFNSAPRYERVSVYSHLWMPRSPGFNVDIQTDTLSSNCELCSGVSGAVGREKWTPLEREAQFVLFLESLMHIFALALFSLAPPVHLPLNQSCLRQMVHPKNSAGWLIPAEIGLGLALSLSLSVNPTAGDS